MASRKPPKPKSVYDKRLGYVFLNIIEGKPDQLCLKLEGEITWPGFNSTQVRSKITEIMNLLCGAQLTDRT